MMTPEKTAVFTAEEWTILLLAAGRYRMSIEDKIANGDLRADSDLLVLAQSIENKIEDTAISDPHVMVVREQKRMRIVPVPNRMESRDDASD